MEIESCVSLSTYCKRYGLNDFSNPPLKKPKYSPTSVIDISDSPTNSIISPLPQNPNFAVKLSPIILHLRKKMRSSRPVFKKKSTSSVVVITKEAFEAKGVKKSSSWVKSQLLGQGSYGSVYLAKSKIENDKIERAIKSAEISKASSLMEEERILTRLSSPFVVRCHGHEIVREQTLFGGGQRKSYNLILEYCSGKSLFHLIQTNGGGLWEKEVKVFTRDILSGLRYIHDQNIIHCDIKPDNLLLCPTDNRVRPNGYLTKIGDFGLALEKGSSEYVNGCGHMRGTTRYMAPELIRHGIVDFAVDVWSLGCTVLEMFTGQVAWEEHCDLGSVDWDKLIGESDFIPYIPDWLSKEAQHFLSKCLVREPGSRWGISALMNHPFALPFWM